MQTFIKNNYLVTLGINDRSSSCTKCSYNHICENKNIKVSNKILQILDICLTCNIKYITNTHFYIKNIASINYYKLML